jgi:hypothetical protein
LSAFAKPDLNISLIKAASARWDGSWRLWEYVTMKSWNFAGALIASVLLTGCGGPEKEDLTRVATKFNMTLEEKVAFKACYDKTDGTKPVIRFGKDMMRMSEVPLEVCGCQAKPMLTMMKPGSFDSYNMFTKWMTKLDRKKDVAFRYKDLKSGVDNKTATAALAKSFDACATAVLNEKPALVKQILTLAVDKSQQKQLAEKRKKEKAKAAAEAAKKQQIDF